MKNKLVDSKEFRELKEMVYHSPTTTLGLKTIYLIQNQWENAPLVITKLSDIINTLDKNTNKAAYIWLIGVRNAPSALLSGMLSIKSEPKPFYVKVVVPDMSSFIIEVTEDQTYHIMKKK